MVKAPVLSLKHKNLTPAHAVYTAIILIANSRFLLSFYLVLYFVRYFNLLAQFI